MDTRVPVQHYNLRSANPYLGSSLHDLNTIDDDRPGDIDGIGSHDVVTDDSLDNGDESDDNIMAMYQKIYRGDSQWLVTKSA
ncbi:hypothetical protein RJ639_046632 [Escallonia herrerae]|uniref:Uncharacterized protein n=1 Tax=Escallonia herrerae TaxID=1293975 RepID=A0AA88W7E1_9ASTE|nr:hypothetical protein RJ639_046632 [Escallonia herrerae]